MNIESQLPLYPLKEFGHVFVVSDFCPVLWAFSLRSRVGGAELTLL